MDNARQPAATPHAYYVNNRVYTGIYDEDIIHHMVATSIEAIFTLLEDCDLSHW
jgi:hypothetical protein